MPLAFQKRVSWRHQLLVRRLDEDPHRQLVALGVEGVADDPADAGAAIEHRRADVERAEVEGAQHEDLAGLAAQHEGRRLEALELGPRLGRDAGVGADVGAGEERAEAGDAADADARPDHPERGVLDREVGRRALEPDADDDALAIVAQRHRLNLADHHLLVADVGLAGLDAVGGSELDVDPRTDEKDAAHQQRGADRDRHRRQQPDQRDVPAPRLDDPRLRQDLGARRRRPRRLRSGSARRCRRLRRIRLVVRHAGPPSRSRPPAASRRRRGVVPDELRVEGVGREHGQHDHRREREQARPGLHAGERTEADGRGEQDDDVDVEHRPVPHRLDQPVQLGALESAPAPAHAARSRRAARGRRSSAPARRCWR